MIYKFIKIHPPFDIRKDFWENNYQLSLINPFKKLYDRDKTKDKNISSKEMWCIWLNCDPSYDNKVIRMSEELKKSAILSYFPEFNDKDEVIAECILQYEEFCLTPAAKSFKIEEESLAKRAKFIEEAEYTFPSPLLDKSGNQMFVGGKPVFMPGTAKDIDMMRKTTLDLMKKYAIVKKMFEEEQSSELVIYGGGQETLMDEGGLMELDD